MDLHVLAKTLERGGALEKLDAIRHLAAMGGVRAGGLLARALAHERDAEVAVALIRGLADLGLKRSLPALEKALNSELALANGGRFVESVSRAAVEALAVYSAVSSLPALVRHFENPRADRNVLPAVARLIVALGETGEFHILKRALDRRSTVWSAAIQALASPYYRVHASAVAALLDEADAHQAMLILRTLAAMHATEQAGTVRRFLTTGAIQDPLEVREAERLLEGLERQPARRPPATPAVGRG